MHNIGETTENPVKQEAIKKASVDSLSNTISPELMAHEKIQERQRKK